MNWREYWNQDTPIYVSDRHKTLHYQRIAADIAALVPSPQAHVLDHGCGEARSGFLRQTILRLDLAIEWCQLVPHHSAGGGPQFIECRSLHRMRLYKTFCRCVATATVSPR